MKKDIGKRVENIRKNMNMTKEQFAKLIGMTGQYLGTVERGTNGLTIEKVMKICEKTKVSADYLLFGKNTSLNEKTKKVLSEFSEEQIHSTFEIIENIAIFIKNQK